MVAEVVGLLGYTKNARILTNPATEILHSAAYRVGSLATQSIQRGNAVKRF